MRKKLIKSFFGALVVFQVFGVIAPENLEAKSYRRMSCYDLWYERNSIFAKRGFCFKTKRGIRHFGRGVFHLMDGCPVGRRI